MIHEIKKLFQNKKYTNPIEPSSGMDIADLYFYFTYAVFDVWDNNQNEPIKNLYNLLSKYPGFMEYYVETYANNANYNDIENASKKFWRKRNYKEQSESYKRGYEDALKYKADTVKYE